MTTVGAIMLAVSGLGVLFALANGNNALNRGSGGKTRWWEYDKASRRKGRN